MNRRCECGHLEDDHDDEGRCLECDDCDGFLEQEKEITTT